MGYPGILWGMAKKAAESRVPIKVSRDTYGMTKALVAAASRNGWASLGIDREDAATMTTVIEEAVRLLDARSRKGGSK